MRRLAFELISQSANHSVRNTIYYITWCKCWVAQWCFLEDKPCHGVCWSCTGFPSGSLVFKLVFPLSPTAVVFPRFSVTDLKKGLSLAVYMVMHTQCIKMAVAIKTPITMIQNCIAVSSNVSSLSAESSVAFSGNPVQQSVPQHSLRLWFFTEELITSFWTLLRPSHLTKDNYQSINCNF